MNAQVLPAHEEEEACFLPFWMADIPLDRILIPDEEEIRVTQSTAESESAMSQTFQIIVTCDLTSIAVNMFFLVYFLSRIAKKGQ